MFVFKIILKDTTELTLNNQCDDVLFMDNGFVACRKENGKDDYTTLAIVPNDNISYIERVEV